MPIVIAEDKTSVDVSFGYALRRVLLPYIYIEKVLSELRPELLSAMHAAMEGQSRKGPVDIDRLYRAFTRAAAGKCANPQRVSERCVAETSSVTRAYKAKERVPEE